MMDFDDDFDLTFNDLQYHGLLNDHQKDLFDLPISHSTPSLPRLKTSAAPPPPIRSVDFPSIKKHHGTLTFVDYQLPIIYRLMNDNVYIPYIRFSYVPHIFKHCTHQIDIGNLPVIEMTSAERVYYDQLSSNDHSDWSNNQLLSVSILDCLLAMIDLAEYFHSRNQRCENWHEALKTVRDEARLRWTLDETIVSERLSKKQENESTCISSTNMAKRRSFFEQRLDLSIVSEAGGFIQIDAYIYPFVKNASDDQIYLNLNDISQHHILPRPHLISHADRNSDMSRAYRVLLEQAQTNYQWNVIRRGRNDDLSKALPFGKSTEEDFYEELPFVSLPTLLHLFCNKDSSLNIQFVQLFESSGLEEIELNYKSNLARQFIMSTKRQGGFWSDSNNNDHYLPCLICDQQVIYVPSERKSRRMMTNDERLYLNLILLYHGLWKDVLPRKKQWYLEEIDGNDKENMHLERFI